MAPMMVKKRQRLEAKGWTIGTASEFLELPEPVGAYIEIRFQLTQGLKRRRLRRRVSRAELARRVHSSPSRIAKMEAGDPKVSIDLLIRTFLALGATRQDVADLIAGGTSARAP